MFPSRAGPVAQSVEQLTFNQQVAGSIPAGLTRFQQIRLAGGVCRHNLRERHTEVVMRLLQCASSERLWLGRTLRVYPPGSADSGGAGDCGTTPPRRENMRGRIEKYPYSSGGSQCSDTSIRH